MLSADEEGFSVHSSAVPAENASLLAARPWHTDRSGITLITTAELVSAHNYGETRGTLKPVAAAKKLEAS